MNKYNWIGFVAACLSCFFLFGCGRILSYEASAIDAGVITFPGPVGEWIIPLEGLFTYQYRFTELNGESGEISNVSRLPLYVNDKGNGLYGFGYETKDSGLLLFQKPGLDSAAGIYIVGKFLKDTNYLQDTVLWLQQFPQEGIVRRLGPDWTITCISTDTAYYSKIHINGKNISRGDEQPFFKNSAYLFVEKQRGREFYYHLCKGIGILGMEEVADGKTAAIGTLDCPCY